MSDDATSLERDGVVHVSFPSFLMLGLQLQSMRDARGCLDTLHRLTHITSSLSSHHQGRVALDWAGESIRQTSLVSTADYLKTQADFHAAIEQSARKDR